MEKENRQKTLVKSLSYLLLLITWYPSMGQQSITQEKPKALSSRRPDISQTLTEMKPDRNKKRLFSERDTSVRFSTQYNREEIFFTRNRSSLEENMSEKGMEERLEDLFLEMSMEREQNHGSGKNINDIDREGLENLFLLTPWQIEALLHYRESYGTILHPSELLHYIHGFDSLTVQNLTRFLTFGPQETYSSISREGSVHEILARYGRTLKTASAYRKNRFQGSANEYYLRYRWQTDNGFQTGIAAQKDAGEPFRKEGFDSYTAYLMLSEKGILDKMILGCFRPRFGWGLHLNQSSSFYRNFSPELMATLPQGLQAVASGAEYGFLQGAGFSFRLPRRWKIHILYSYRKRDAGFNNGEFPLTGSVPDDSIALYSRDPQYPYTPQLDHYLSSFSETGYHRTVNEIQKRDRLLEQTAGMVLEKTFQKAKIGFTGSFTRWGGIYNPENSFQRTSFLISTSRPVSGGAGSAYYQVLAGKHHFYGELAASHFAATGMAILQAWQWQPSESFSFLTEFQLFSPSYYSPYSTTPRTSPLSTSNRPQFTQIEWAAETPIGKTNRTRLSGGFRTVRNHQGFPVNTFHLELESVSLLTVTELIFSLQYRRSTSREGFLSENIVKFKRPDWLIAETRFLMRNGLKACTLAQDIGARLLQDRLSFRLRIALFHTPDFQDRLYLYEHDLLYASRAVTLYGKGMRINLVFRHQWTNGLTLELKYGQTLYDQQTHFGSGDMEYKGYLKPEIRLQFRYRFRH